MTDEQNGNPGVEWGRFLAWAAVGILAMAGCVAPVGFLLWIPAAALAGLLIAFKVRSPRYFFSFVTGLGLTLFGLGILNGTYAILLLFGLLVIAGGIVFFTAFGSRISHADPPSGD